MRYFKSKGADTKKPSVWELEGHLLWLMVHRCTCVLVPAGVELNFFLVGGLLPWMRITSITRWYCSCCWAVLTASQGPFSFPSHQQGGWGTQEAGRRHSQGNWPQRCSRPHEIMLRIKTRGKSGQGLLLRNWPGISEWEVRSCILHHLGNNDGVNGECVGWSRTPVNKGGSWFFYLVQLPLIFFLPITKYNTSFASTEMILGSCWTWCVTPEWHKASLAMHRQVLNPFRKLHLFFQQKGLDLPTGRVHPSLPTGSHASGAN